MSSPAIPLGAARSFRAGAGRVSLARAVLLVVLAVALVVALLAALRSRPATALPLSRGASGIVVLDVSASISTDTYDRIAATLERLERSGLSFGLVLFSDTAYQALPPRTPSNALEPFARLFRVPKTAGPGALPEPPSSPWGQTFSAGTRISTGLELALGVIRADRLSRPAVLLVSDLDDDTSDLENVSRVATAYRRAGVALHVVGLNPEPQDVAFMRRLLPSNGSFTRAPATAERASRPETGDTAAVVGAGLVAACALAALCFLTRPLRWREP